MIIRLRSDREICRYKLFRYTYYIQYTYICGVYWGPFIKDVINLLRFLSLLLGPGLCLMPTTFHDFTLFVGLSHFTAGSPNEGRTLSACDGGSRLWKVRGHFFLISFISKIIFWKTPSPLLDDVFYKQPLSYKTSLGGIYTPL